MTKLTNGVEYLNPHFDSSFAEFLLANHFQCIAYKNTLRFSLRGTLLIITNDQVDMYCYNPEEEGQEAEKWVFVQSHTGIAQFNIFGWIMLMHIMNVLRVNEFISNARKLGVQEATEADFIIKSAFHNLQKAS